MTGRQTGFWCIRLRMHEMSIVTSLLAIITEEMAKHGASKLLMARVRYGTLTNIVPDSMEFAFENLTRGTPMEGARLELVEVPVTLRCVTCEHSFLAQGHADFFHACPECGALVGHSVDAGRELYLDHLEAE